MTRTQSSTLLAAFLLALVPANAQNPQPPPHSAPQVPEGSVPGITVPDDSKRHDQPRCSTEIANDDCYIVINRLYPYSYPGFLMKPNASMTVKVFNPLGFEKLTLEPSTPATVYQSTDQFGSLVTAIGPGVKGATIDGNTFVNMFADVVQGDIANFTNFIPPPTPTASSLDKDIQAEEKDLSAMLDSAVATYINPYTTYKNQTNVIYHQVRLISLAVPRPVNDPDQTLIDQSIFDGVACPNSNDPWHTYGPWRQCMIKDLLIQGVSGSKLWALFPNKCQTQQVMTSPWTVPTPQCATAGDSVFPSHGPQIDTGFDAEYKTLTENLTTLSALHDPNYPALQATAVAIEQRHDHIANFLAGILGAVPATLTKISTDMQNFYIALLNAPPGDPNSEITLGTIYGPRAMAIASKAVRKYLGVPFGLAPTITYNVNGQNLVTSTLLSAPAATQRTLVAAIPLTFANPRFETSSGVFLSFLNNRTFANITEVAVTGTGASGVPAATDVKLTETVTNRPLIIPYYAAHFRPFPEWTWPGRRGAFYLTGALGVNPYQTDLEYAAGFSISWRYLIFSPVYHLGRSTHLTSGEQVGQIYCVYNPPMGSTATPCTGAPPAPTIKNYLTGAFAIGIGVRIPTTFASTNK